MKTSNQNWGPRWQRQRGNWIFLYCKWSEWLGGRREYRGRGSGGEGRGGGGVTERGRGKGNKWRAGLGRGGNCEGVLTIRRPLWWRWWWMPRDKTTSHPGSGPRSPTMLCRRATNKVMLSQIGNLVQSSTVHYWLFGTFGVTTLQTPILINVHEITCERFRWILTTYDNGIASSVFWRAGILIELAKYTRKCFYLGHKCIRLVVHGSSAINRFLVRRLLESRWKAVRGKRKEGKWTAMTIPAARSMHGNGCYMTGVLMSWDTELKLILD